MFTKRQSPVFVFNENSDLKGVIHHQIELENLPRSLLRAWRLNAYYDFKDSADQEKLKRYDENDDDTILAELDEID